MITYRLSSRNGDSLPNEQDLSKKANKEFLFRRILKKTRCRIGTPVAVAHTKLKGVIKEIIDDFDKVEWKGGTPFHIVVELEDGKLIACSRAQIWTRRRAEV